MSTNKISPEVQSAKSDEALALEWRRLCLVNGCAEDELDDTERALQQLGPEMARLRLTQAVSRLTARAR
jgi:hypothetical protein